MSKFNRLMPGRGGIAVAALLVGAAIATAAEDPAAPRSRDCLADDGVRSGESLTDKLDDCNSVLTPPKIGDSEIVEPAPEIGNMPVLKPGDLPPDDNP